MMVYEEGRAGLNICYKASMGRTDGMGSIVSSAPHSIESLRFFVNSISPHLHRRLSLVIPHRPIVVSRRTASRHSSVTLYVSRDLGRPSAHQFNQSDIMATETATIPEPPGLPLIGNAPIPGLGSKINAGELADKYGQLQ